MHSQATGSDVSGSAHSIIMRFSAANAPSLLLLLLLLKAYLLVIHTHTHIHTHMHTHMHTHTCTHTHTHTRFILTLACCSIRDKAWSLSSWASCCSPCSVHISSACCLRAASTCACSCAFTACSCASASCAAQMGIGYKVIEAAAMHESVS